MKEKFQTFGKAMLVPISLVAIGGLLLGVGGAGTNELTVSALGVNWEVYSQGFIFNVFEMIKGLGDVIFSNLSILYAVGVAFSLAKNQKGWAAFSAVVAFLAMSITIQGLLTSRGLSADATNIQNLISGGMDPLEASQIAALYTTQLGFFTYRTGVFGGIAVGVMVAYLHQRFYRTKLPMALSFFSGTRTVPIISLIAGGFLGLFFGYTWGFIGVALSGFAVFVKNTGLFGTFIYRLVNESLIPFGLHPLVSLPMRWSELGGSMMVDGELVVGNAAIQLAQLASPGSEKLLVRALMGGSAIVNFAIFPGIALAMYHTARPENKKKVAGLLIPTIISTTLFGITEPILFTFLFIAPWLYFLVHVPLAALAETASEFFKVSIYQGNIKDWIPFLLRPEKLYVTPFLWLWPAFFILAYFLFKYLIVRFDVQTPGREEDVEEEDIQLYSRAEYEEKVAQQKIASGRDNLSESTTKVKSKQKSKSEKENEELDLARNIIMGLGGPDNIIEVDNCISRLRILIKDMDQVGSDTLFTNQLGAMGVVRFDESLQIIYGAQVAGIAADINYILEGEE